MQEGELHLRAEKQGFEPKEVIVRHSSETTLLDGSVPGMSFYSQKKPGGILIGHRWPDEVRFIFKETLVVPDLLHIEVEASQDAINFKGFHQYEKWGISGLCVIFFKEAFKVSHRFGTLCTFAHEMAHAHQQAVAAFHGYGINDWTETPEGKAYTAARNKDLAEAEDWILDRLHSERETAAEVCSIYWSERFLPDDSRPWFERMQRKMPNRLKWGRGSGSIKSTKQ